MRDADACGAVDPINGFICERGKHHPGAHHRCGIHPYGCVEW